MTRRKFGCGVAALLLLIAALVIAWPWLYFGPSLPRQDHRAAWKEHVLRANGVGVNAAERTWERYQLVRKLQTSAYEYVFSSQKPSSSGGSALRDLIDFDPAGGMSDEQRQQAERLLDRMKSIGLFETLDPLAQDKAFLRPLPPTGLLMATDLGDLSDNRALFRALRFQARRAAAAGDVQEVERTLRRCLALARVCAAEPIAISWMVGVAIAVATADEAMTLAANGSLPSDACKRLAQDLLDFQALKIEDLMEGEAVLIRDTLQVTLGDTPILPFNRSGQTAKANEVFQSAKDWAALPAWKRRDKVAFDLEGARSLRYKPALMLLPAFEKFGATHDRFETTRLGAAILLAAHAYAAEKGEPPGQLEQLVPGSLASLPADPWSGKPFRYKVLDMPDEQGRRFRVYSVGWDGEDNGGTVHPRDMALQKAGAGTDFVIGVPSTK